MSRIKAIFIVVALFHFANRSFTQDILPNGSFEEDRKLVFTKDAKTWKVCIADDSPDLFCVTNRETKEIFSLYKGGVKPLSGDCVIGLFVYRVDMALHYQNVREFVYEKLKNTLKKDSTYDIELYVCLDAESNVAIKNFDVCFAKNKIETKSLKSMLKMNPQVSFNSFFLDSCKWMRLHAEYKASGIEDYIAIGNFHPDDQTDTKQVQSIIDSRKPKWNLTEGEKAAYYYIDNIRITPVKRINSPVSNIKNIDTTETSHAFEFSNIKSDTSITVRNIYFAFDNAEIMNQSYSVLLQLVDALRNNPKINVEIQGHTDNVGSDAYNINLSEKRAKAVCVFLNKNGIPFSRMTYKGYGNTVPIADNNTITGQDLNRRVVFKFSNNKYD